MPQAEFDLVSRALEKLPGAFGRPHAHAGLRKLRGGIYEFRAGLESRLLFRRDRGCLVLLFLGTHDDIRRFLARL